MCFRSSLTRSGRGELDMKLVSHPGTGGAAGSEPRACPLESATSQSSMWRSQKQISHVDIKEQDIQRCDLGIPTMGSQPEVEITFQTRGLQWGKAWDIGHLLALPRRFPALKARYTEDQDSGRASLFFTCGMVRTHSCRG